MTSPSIIHGEPEIGDEIWQQPLSDTIRAEAETIADYAGPGLLRCLAVPSESRSATTSSSK